MERDNTITDNQLHIRLRERVEDERHCLAEILADMAEVDRRKSYRAAGYASMLSYTMRHLGYDEDAGKNRIQAARLLGDYPMIGPLVAEGALHLSGLRLLGPRLSQTNHRELCLAASYQSKRQIHELLAARFPKSDVLPLIVSAQPRSAIGASAPPSGRSPASPAPGPVATTRSQPLSADSFSITFTIDRSCHDKLIQAQALLRHAIPSGDIGTIVHRALDALLKQEHTRKYAATDKPRAAQMTPRRTNGRHVPADVKRDVHQRDGDRCAFVSADGKRCDEVAWLELHHVEPHGRGGAPTVDNLRIYCRVHNDYQAELDYGREHMKQARSSPPQPATLPTTLISDAFAALSQLGARAHPNPQRGD